MSSLPLTLSTNRLLIRELQPSDHDGLIEIVTDSAVTRDMHIEPWDTTEGRRQWFEWCLSNQIDRVGGNYNWGFVLKSTGDFVGWIGIGDSDRKEREGDRSMGFMVARRFWSQGLMTEALEAVLHYEFTVLDVARVTANCETENVASARVMEKVGIRFVRTVTDADPLEGNLAERHHFALEKPDYRLTRANFA